MFITFWPMKATNDVLEINFGSLVDSKMLQILRQSKALRNEEFSYRQTNVVQAQENIALFCF